METECEISKFLEEKPEWIFTENETNSEKLYNVPQYTKYVKDGFHSYVVNGNKEAINAKRRGSQKNEKIKLIGKGTKVAAYHKIKIPAKTTVTLRLRFYSEEETPKTPFGPEFEGRKNK